MWGQGTPRRQGGAVPLWAQGAGLELPLRESYLVEVSHILAVLQDPGVEGLPWVGKRRV